MRTGVAILGATGSVGSSTLDVIARHPDRFRVSALSAHRDVEQLAQQCARFEVPYAVIADTAMEGDLRRALKAHGSNAQVLSGQDGMCAVTELSETDAVMAAVVGAAGLLSALHAVRHGKRLMLANKESMVIAGELFAQAARASGADIIPVDSEHNALFQALPQRFDGDLEEVGVEQLILTASGGPFLDRPADTLADVTPDEACAHPNWDMGRKISVDSATLMNKGLEVIEARWLFNAEPSRISVLIHPQSIVHSMVAYRDGSVLAQMGMPDMRTPIAHALAWPDRIEAGVQRLHLHEMAHLEFRQPDPGRFPCLKLAFDVLEAGGNAPVLLNAANECAVEAFLEKRVSFTDIPILVEKTLETAAWDRVSELGDVIEFDRMGRAIARQEIQSMENRNG